MNGMEFVGLTTRIDLLNYSLSSRLSIPPEARHSHMKGICPVDGRNYIFYRKVVSTTTTISRF
jgi:hypothetical protein